MPASDELANISKVAGEIITSAAVNNTLSGLISRLDSEYVPSTDTHVNFTRDTMNKGLEVLSSLEDDAFISINTPPDVLDLLLAYDRTITVLTDHPRLPDLKEDVPEEAWNAIIAKTIPWWGVEGDTYPIWIGDGKYLILQQEPVCCISVAKLHPDFKHDSHISAGVVREIFTEYVVEDNINVLPAIHTLVSRIEDQYKELPFSSTTKVRWQQQIMYRLYGRVAILALIIEARAYLVEDILQGVVNAK
jgi:hypothetical protein